MNASTVLQVKVWAPDRTRKEALDRIEAAERGEDVEPRHVLNFESGADLARLTSEANLELLRAIAQHEPGSIRQAAELVDRDYKEVHRNLTELEALNVVEFETEGRAKRPVMRFDRIEIEVPMTDVDDDGNPAPA